SVLIPERIFFRRRSRRWAAAGVAVAPTTPVALAATTAAEAITVRLDGLRSCMRACSFQPCWSGELRESPGEPNSAQRSPRILAGARGLDIIGLDKARLLPPRALRAAPLAG